MKKKNEPKVRIAATVFMALMVTSVFAVLAIGVVSATTWYVEEGESIQAAVDAASARDTIIARDGTYTENINVYKRLAIKSENGSANCIVQAANPDDHVFEVTADYVNISGFTVKRAGYHYHKAGIYLGSVDYCNISNNNASNNDYGISLYSSNNNTLTNNAANSNKYYGICLSVSNSNILENNNANSNNGEGIRLYSSNNNALKKNIMSENRYNFGIDGYELSHFIQNIDTSNKVDGKPIYYWIDQQDQQVPDDAGFVGIINSKNITVKDLTLTNNSMGVLFANTNNSRIENITASSNRYGIYLRYSSNNILTNNTIAGETHGAWLDAVYPWYLHSPSNICLLHSSYNKIENNTISKKGDRYLDSDLSWSCNNEIKNNTFVNSGLYFSRSYRNIVEDNTVNGKPLVYLEDKSDQEITNAGQVILVNCDNITVKNLDLSNASGIGLLKTKNCNISNNICAYNRYGICLSDSDNNSIFNNNCSNNGGNGIYISGSSSIIKNNTANNNHGDGIRLSGSSSIIKNNTANNNHRDGIKLSGSSNSIKNNTASNNHGNGIRLSGCNDNIISNNNANSNKDPGYCGGDSSGIKLSDSSNNIITNNNALNNWVGIRLSSYCSNNIISNNTVNSNTWEGGICLYLDSSNNTIINNNVRSNRNGIRLASDNNLIYLNNFVDNGYRVYGEVKNTWNSPSKITYTYNGSTYTNYLGNYWDDYKGLDENSDGIGDTPCSIESDWDYHPLVEPFENYFAPIENIFDTGAPTNPYPSIFGTHTGTITPSCSVNVSTLYTYPCPGTGGHTEYAEIGNATWNATATWEGYAGDWHNISFDKTVVLLANEEYNYTIRTGSYPQIHHTPELPTANGWINCTEFVDANGKKYTNWIPAIRLWCDTK